MYYRKLRLSRSPSIDQKNQKLRTKRDFSMRSDSCKHISDMDLYVLKNLFNIQPLTKFEESKSEVLNANKIERNILLKRLLY